MTNREHATRVFDRCASCGAPLLKKLGDTLPAGGGDRCPGCYRPDGSPKSKDEIIAAMASWLVDALDLQPSAARAIAAERISSLPAWKDCRR